MRRGRQVYLHRQAFKPESSIRNFLLIMKKVFIAISAALLSMGAYAQDAQQAAADAAKAMEAAPEAPAKVDTQEVIDLMNTIKSGRDSGEKSKRTLSSFRLELKLLTETENNLRKSHHAMKSSSSAREDIINARKKYLQKQQNRTIYIILNVIV